MAPIPKRSPCRRRLSPTMARVIWKCVPPPTVRVLSVVNYYRRWCYRMPGPITCGTLEPENRDDDRCFVDAGYSQLNNGFDDLVVWIPTGVLYNRLVAAGTLP